MTKWYEEMFENYAENYAKEVFVHGTKGEVNFLEQELNFNKNAKILDIGCGIGRHSLELARRGYHNVTGFDLSQAMLNKAIAEAKKEGLQVKFLRKNALDFNFNREYDLAMIMCEGAFGLMETDEKNFKILENMSASLIDGGKFIITTLNAQYPLTHSMEDFGDYEDLSFDLVNLRHRYRYEITQDDGTKKMIEGEDRFFVPTEIKWYLKSLGFGKIDIFGAKLGAFSRNDKLSPEDFEMLVIAEK